MTNVKRLSQFKLERKDKHQVYKDALSRLIDDMLGRQDDITHNDFIKVIHLSVHIISTMPDIKNPKQLEEYEQYMNNVRSLMYFLTIKELKQMYPPEKTDDGAKWQTKDYYSTMEELAAYDEESQLGDNMNEVLWGYHNWTINQFTVNSLSIMSDIMVANGKPSVGEAFCQHFQIPMYEQQSNGELKQVWQKPNLEVITNN